MTAAGPPPALPADWRLFVGLLILAVGGAIHIPPALTDSAAEHRLSIAATPAHDGGVIYTATLRPALTDADLHELMEGP